MKTFNLVDASPNIIEHFVEAILLYNLPCCAQHEGGVEANIKINLERPQLVTSKKRLKGFAYIDAYNVIMIQPYISPRSQRHFYELSALGKQEEDCIPSRKSGLVMICLHRQ